eukprot:Seg5371.1 transcript_id=Seg5371.1/GoldUCD/mRNA.D3Y31 product="putative transport protein YPL264C" protein_id=Seg5371.1/GoldUCD/D3Y31
MAEKIKRSKLSRIKGLSLMAAAGFYITMSNCLVQFAYKSTHTEISPHVFLFYRSIVVFVLNLCFMLAGRVHPFGQPQNIFVLCLMGMAGTGQILFTFLALERVPIGDATVIQFTAPVFTMTFSFLLLGVSCTVFDTLCGCVSFIGVVIMTKPSIFFGKHPNDHTEYPTNLNPDEDVAKADEQDCLIGIAFALLASIFVSAFYVLNKILGQKHDLTVTIFYPSLIGIMIAPIVSTALGESLIVPWHWASIAVVLLVGLLSFVHLLFVAEALQLEDAGPASLVRNADIVYAFILQYFFLGIKPEVSTLFGAGMIVAATTLIALRRMLQARQEIDAD